VRAGCPDDGRRILRAAGELRFHDLRHFFAVSYLRAGGNIYDLQKTLGHTSIKTTEIYLDFLTPEEQHIAMFGPAQKPAQI
jgi:integrase/recombinase XerD